jgi:NAD(P)-dependent dehydrogenase (short-subunit alcohol dehydrogenase family)
LGPLAGRVAVVTGAGRGVGRAEAVHLAELGAFVVVNDLGIGPGGETAREDPASAVVEEILAAGGDAVVNHDDVASIGGAEKLIGQALDVFGRLDVLVNNAGILRDRMIFNMSEEDWDAVARVHLKGHFGPTRAATAHWRSEAKAGRPVDGRVVCTGSSSGLFGNAGQANYAAAKAGIAAFAIVVAREMAKYGVTCNTICPIARTRLMAQALRAHGVDHAAVAPDGSRSDALDPAHVARFVGFLACPEAAHISGQTFIVGGGRIQLADGWHVVAEHPTMRPLDHDEIGTVLDQLFSGRAQQPRSFQDAARMTSTSIATETEPS